ncbi:MAG TPA: 2-hydroxyacid dehydrogenase [Patescibacteria group bacterium]|nr:2-hydroxyacid dehydrogenase [Patescibacteria group bacterium]
MKIVLADQIDLQPEILEEIRKLGELTVYDDIPKDKHEIITRIQDAEIMTANWIDITEEIIDHAPSHLKYIIVPAVGYDWIHVDAARAKGIKVLNSPTHNTSAVANYTIGAIITITRQILTANTDLKQGTWKPMDYKGTEIEGKKLGLIGHGNIGQKVAELAQKLGMKVHFADSHATDEQIDTLLKESDIVSLHLPLTEKTKHLLDERRLRLMKKDSFLVNTARGAIIDQKALISLLNEGHFAGVALDVFEDEPLTGAPNQEIIHLANMPRVLATPHIAFNSIQTWERLGHELLANIKSCVEGNPINVVN